MNLDSFASFTCFNGVVDTSANGVHNRNVSFENWSRSSCLKNFRYGILGIFEVKHSRN